MLVRLFCREGGFHPTECFNRQATLPVSDELIIYTWSDATLKEISQLIQEVYPESRTLNTTFTFKLISRNSSMKSYSLDSRNIGTVKNTQHDANCLKSDPTLNDFKYVPGDYIDVAIFSAKYD